MKTFQIMYTNLDKNIGTTSEVWDGDEFITASWVSCDLTLVVTVEDDFDEDYIESLAQRLLWDANLDMKKFKDKGDFTSVNRLLRTEEALYSPSVYGFIGYKEINGVD